MPGRVAELAPVGAARHVERAPQRLVRHGHEQVAPRAAGHLGERRARGSGRARAPRSPSRRRTRRRRRAAPRPGGRRTRGWARVRFAHSAASGGSSRSMPTTRAGAIARAQRCVTTPSPQPMSSSDAGLGGRQQVIHVALEARHQPPHDRVARAVLVVGVAGDDAVGAYDLGASSALGAHRARRARVLRAAAHAPRS